MKYFVNIATLVAVLFGLYVGVADIFSPEPSALKIKRIAQKVAAAK